MTSASAVGRGPGRKGAPRRMSKLQLVGLLSIDKMHEVWLWKPAQALPQHDYMNLLQDCRCANHSHRRKDCPVGKGKRCTICGVLYQDYGNMSGYCPPCLDYWEMRRDYLDEYAATHVKGASLQGQLT